MKVTLPFLNLFGFLGLQFSIMWVGLMTSIPPSSFTRILGTGFDINEYSLLSLLHYIFIKLSFLFFSYVYSSLRYGKSLLPIENLLSSKTSADFSFSPVFFRFVSK